MKTLNLPAVRDVSCLTGCSWTRTVQSGQDFVTSWDVTDTVIDGSISIDVTPSSFSFLPAAKLMCYSLMMRGYNAGYTGELQAAY